ncbi:DUF3575 domain-containing protein [Pseudopedobacter beijingensis]|uniref:DUF3575 domain-containing protein n=1 Tax=Pseudopedobacter beijingensis TaxID=1207056 RepID=A0ABW4II49_9SPHI
MKKLLPIILMFVLVSVVSYAQQEDNTSSEHSKETKENEYAETTDFGRNELKLNFSSIVLSTVDISYERIFEDNTAAGLALSYCFASKDYHADPSEFVWSVMPYYRFYFGKKQSAGLFIEAHAHAAQTRKIGDVYYSDPLNFWRNEGNYKDNFGYGFGFAVGTKLLTVKGLIGEVFFGAGRYLNKADGMPQIYPRVGITIGKRF